MKRCRWLKNYLEQIRQGILAVLIQEQVVCCLFVLARQPSFLNFYWSLISSILLPVNWEKPQPAVIASAKSLKNESLKILVLNLLNKSCQNLEVKFCNYHRCILQLNTKDSLYIN